MDVHRKNSSESGEEVATLRPVVERVSVHQAERCTQADHERFRTKLQGNSFCSVVTCSHVNKDIWLNIAVEWVALLFCTLEVTFKFWPEGDYPDSGFYGFARPLPADY